eukprot:419343_1
MFYGRYVMGGIVKIDGHKYYANGVKFAKHSQQSKGRHGLWQKLQLCVGISAPSVTTYKRYRHTVDNKNNNLASTSMKHAREKLKSEKLETGVAIGASDSSWCKKGFNANGSQHSMFGKFQEYDPRTGKNSKVIANDIQHKKKKVGAFVGPSGNMEAVSMVNCLQTCYDDNLEITCLTKDNDSRSKKELKKFNKRNNTNTSKCDDPNHKAKGI